MVRSSVTIMVFYFVCSSLLVPVVNCSENDLLSLRSRLLRDKNRILSQDYRHSAGQYTLSEIDELDQLLNDLEQFNDTRRLSSRPSRKAEEGNVTAVKVPKAMNIALLVVGTRGDVSPFIELAKRLRKDGHRTRIATHEVHRNMVQEAGIDFRPIAGDPELLSQFMVKTKGKLLPVDCLFSCSYNDLAINHKMVREIQTSTWPAVVDKKGVPNRFVPDALISNPVTYGHIHIAEKLRIPLHIMFPQPWISTRAYAHPLAGLSFKRQWTIINFVSYKVVDEIMWRATAAFSNQFRKTLALPPIPATSNCGRELLTNVPHAFLYSPHFVPKALDWGKKVDVVGALSNPPVVDTADLSWLDPPELHALRDFLQTKEKPIFIGFGSMVINDPTKLADRIIQAAEKANVRVILQSGWSKLVPSDNIFPENVISIGSAPHSKLFQQVRAVVHHGGAGTTSAGLLAGLPTLVVPFFGDQPFWGEMVYRRGVGPAPIPIGSLMVNALTDALTALNDTTIQANCKELSREMRNENGVEAATQAFYKHYWNAPRIDTNKPVQRGNVRYTEPSKDCFSLLHFLRNVRDNLAFAVAGVFPEL